MEKLIITATVDAINSYPGCPYNPEGLENITEEYRRCVAAGASIVHLHGPHFTDKEIQADGSKMADLDIAGWQRLKDLIEDKCDPIPIIQYGIANGRIAQRIELMDQKPDMMSISFNAHDERFQPDPAYPAVELYAIHNRLELEEYPRTAQAKGVKPEIETFQLGALWNTLYILKQGLLEKPIWTTLFLGWPGGCWTPPTITSLQWMTQHLPEDFNYSVSVMDPPTQWQLLTVVIIMGGNVRVGMEDNPYVSEGVWAKSNAELVEKIVRIARELGREIATPDEARRIIGLGEKK